MIILNWKENINGELIGFTKNFNNVNKVLNYIEKRPTMLFIEFICDDCEESQFLQENIK